MRPRYSPSGPWQPESAIVVPDIAGLAVHPPTPYPAGALAWIETLRALFVLDRSATEAPVSGQLVVADDGAGLWRRLDVYGSAVSPWAAQTEWYIDANNGDVENDGAAAGRALPCWMELEARLRHQILTATTTVHLASDLDEAIRASWSLRGGYFLLDGCSGITVEGTDTLSVVTAKSAVTNEWLLVQAAGIADWTPYIGRRLRITAGARENCVMWVLAADPDALGAHVARVTLAYNPWTFGTANPQAADPIAIERLPVIQGLWLEPGDSSFGSYHWIRSCAFDQASDNTEIRVDQEAYLTGCRIDYVHVDGSSLFFMGGCLIGPAGGIQRVEPKKLQVWNSGMMGTRIGLREAGESSLISTISQGARINVPRHTYLKDCGAFDASDGVHLELSGSIDIINGMLGKGNGVGVYFERGASFIAYEGGKPVITGATELRINGAVTNWAAVPFWNPVDATGIVT
jgi:hypothetical protein